MVVIVYKVWNIYYTCFYLTQLQILITIVQVSLYMLKYDGYRILSSISIISVISFFIAMFFTIAYVSIRPYSCIP